jgi:PAS domain S-box-containing protein
MPTQDQDLSESARSLELLEREEKKLWRLVLLFLGLVAIGLAAATWQNLQALQYRLELIPLAAVAAVALVAYYAHCKKREIAELRGMVRGLRVGAATLASESRLENLTEVIAASQRGYRDLIDSFDDIIFSLELDGRVRAANTAFTRMVQLPFPEIIGHLIDDFVDEPRRADLQGEIPRFVEQRYWAGRVRVRFRQSGAIRYFDAVLHPILRDHQVVGVSVWAHDITGEQVRENRFTELFESLQEGVYFSTPEGKVLDANQALVRMLGFERKEDLLAHNAIDFYCDPADREKSGHELQTSGVLREREIRLRRNDGTEITCLDTARAVWDAKRRNVRFQGTLVDITLRREIESRLREEQEFRRRLVDSFPDLIVALDQTGRLTFVSSRITEMLGYEPQALIGRNISDGASVACSPEFERLCHSLMSGDKLSGAAEYQAQHADGSWRTLRACASPLFDAEGKLAGVVASVCDVSSTKQIEQQLVQSEKMAAMGQMIDGFAHELNNPLTAILGALDLLGETARDETTRKQFQLLQQQARRAAEIVQNLLFFSRPPQPGSVRANVSDLVQRSLQLHEHSLRMNRINVDFLPDIGIPPLLCDPNQVMQVFLSLIINA